MVSNEDFQVVTGGLISSASTDCEVEDLLGYGTFGAVIQCRKLATYETVALKIIRNKTHIEDAKQELKLFKISLKLHLRVFINL